MRSRVYVTVVCPSVCPFVCPVIRPQQRHAAGLLLSAVLRVPVSPAARRSAANADSAIMTAELTKPNADSLRIDRKCFVLVLNATLCCPDCICLCCCLLHTYIHTDLYSATNRENESEALAKDD